MALQETTVGVIADLLKGNQDKALKPCLLIGAGLSISAGIKSSSHYVRHIKENFPNVYQQADNNCGVNIAPNYGQCMAALTPQLRSQLIRNDVESAKINWAHIAIARMVRDKIVDHILTTNFDPLASRACALFNHFPAIHDLTTGNDFDKSFINGSAIFHLHGQHSGFTLLNTEELLQKQADRIRPILNDVMKVTPLIIAGKIGQKYPRLKQNS
jgi:NAD-dependent SIR2 family protein deacetylase